MEKTVDLDDVKAKVAEIEAMKSDNEAARCMEGALRAEFIALVAAAGSPALAAMAREVLKTDDIACSRWCD